MTLWLIMDDRGVFGVIFVMTMVSIELLCIVPACEKYYSDSVAIIAIMGYIII